MCRYGKYIGDQWDTGRGRGPAESKCDVEKDAGWTKADKFETKNKSVLLPRTRQAGGG